VSRGINDLATAHGGCQGHVRSSDRVLDVPLLYPKELAARAARPRTRSQVRTVK
jgi:hypothetical protein